MASQEVAEKRIKILIRSLAFQKTLSVVLRVASLAAKLLLTLYMGRYLSLEDLGVYGLAFSVIMIGTGVLGARLDFVVARDLVGLSGERAFRIIKDQTFFYGVNFLFFGIAAIAAAALGLASMGLGETICAIIFLESLGQAYGTNFISMGRPLLSTFLFFMRSGLWGLVVVVVGLLFPETRNVETVLLAWAIGAGWALFFSLVLARCAVAKGFTRICGLGMAEKIFEEKRARLAWDRRGDHGFGHGSLCRFLLS
jgi:hypothetical protein